MAIGTGGRGIQHGHLEGVAAKGKVETSSEG